MIVLSVTYICYHVMYVLQVGRNSKLYDYLQQAIDELPPGELYIIL